jgi:hypothetical protein
VVVLRSVVIRSSYRADRPVVSRRGSGAKVRAAEPVHELLDRGSWQGAARPLAGSRVRTGEESLLDEPLESVGILRSRKAVQTTS